MPIVLNGDSGITTPTYGGADASEYLVPVTGFKNRLINGAMQIDQRNAGASVTTQGGFSVDRFFLYGSQASKFSAQQNAGSVTPPAGFVNYLGATSLSAYSITSTDQFIISQKVEGLNVGDFNWGTANAATVTLSFWVRSSLTGTFGGSIQNSAANRCYPFSFTISSANTWEQKSITIAGDTTGTWLTTNGVGLLVNFSLGTGSTYSATAGAWTGSSFITSTTGAQSVVGTNGATFYITGVQLEKGSTATSFDYRPFGTELALCQRYYEQSDSAQGSGFFWSGNQVTSTTYYATRSFCVNKRAAATITISNLGLSGFSSVNANESGNLGFRLSSVATSTGNGGLFLGQWTASSEL